MVNRVCCDSIFSVHCWGLCLTVMVHHSVVTGMTHSEPGGSLYSICTTLQDKSCLLKSSGLIVRHALIFFTLPIKQKTYVWILFKCKKYLSERDTSTELILLLAQWWCLASLGLHCIFISRLLSNYVLGEISKATDQHVPLDWRGYWYFQRCGLTP